MSYVLAGDIGGTKTILRLVEAADGQQLNTLAEQEYSSQKYPDLVPMVQEFLHSAQSPPPVRACFAIAGPVVDNSSNLTNLAWSLTGDRLRQELELQRVDLINDFEAVGYGVRGLADTDLHPLQAGDHRPGAPIAIIGAGTGLGQGFLINQKLGYRVFPSEGGHADFAPRSELEFQLLKYLLDKHQIARVSAERVVSGQGIVSIYQFLRDRQYAQESPAVGEPVRTWESQVGKAQKTIDPASVIARAAASGDHLSVKTMEVFVSAYGAEAGNLALKLLPYGGLYIAGGIAAKNLPLMKAGAFLAAFTDKGRMRGLLEQVPVQVVLNPQVGLIGASLRAARELT